MTRERILLITFLGMIVVVGAVLYFGFFRQASSQAPGVFGPLPALPVRPEDMVNEEDLTVFNDARLKTLRQPPAIPVTGSQPKRADPFAPIP